MARLAARLPMNITSAYTTDAGEVACFPGFAVFTLPLVTQARRLRSMLAPRGRLWQKLPPLAQPTQARTPGRENAAQPGEQASSPAKRQSVVITTAYTTDAGETPAFSALQSA